MDGMSPFSSVNQMFEVPRLRNILATYGFSLLDYRTRRGVLSDTLTAKGLSPETFFTNSFEAQLAPEDAEKIRQAIMSLAASSAGKVGIQCRFVNSETGSESWIQMDFELFLATADGQPALVLIHDQDNTELVKAQEEIRERLVEIESLKDLVLSINKSLDFNETSRKIIEHLHRILPFDRATVQVLEGTSLHVIDAYGYPEDQVMGITFPAREIDNPARRAITTRRPIICNDVEHDFEGFVQIPGVASTKSWLGIPLVYEGKTIGMFSLDSSELHFYKEQHIRIASGVADQVAMAVAHSLQHSKVKEAALKDKLTGAANRYGLETVGQTMFTAIQKEEQSLGVLMLDIDHFKEVNDTWGHAYGDLVLKSLAAAVTKSLRADDYLVRYGGEEFLILLPKATAREALVVAERLRQTIPQIEIIPGRSCPTVSIGIFAGIPGPLDQLHEFIQKADLGLYEAKESGRNRCRVWRANPEFFDKGGKNLIL